MEPVELDPIRAGDLKNLGDVTGVRSTSDEPALIDLSDPSRPILSCRDLDLGARAFALGLSRRNLPGGATIGLLGQNSARYLMAYMGIMRAGLVAVPINHKQPRETIDYICREACCRLVIAGASHRDLAPACADAADLEAPEFQDRSWAESPAMYVPAPQDTAQILFTSGSTGRPKGVVLSHRSQIAMLEHIDAGSASALFAGRRAIVAAPLFHMNGLLFTMGTIAHGGTIVLLPKFEARSFIEALHEYRVDILTGVPTMVALMAREADALARADLSSVSIVYIGSAPLTEGIVAAARKLMRNAAILNSYGTTETGGCLFGSHPRGIARPALSVGYPMPHVRLRLVDGDTAFSGTLEVHGPSNMTAYLNQPEKTAEKLRDGWVNTGDRFRIDAHGFYFYVGRVDDMFVCNAENVYPGHLEAILESAPGVAQASVVPLEDERPGAVPIAFIVPAAGASLTEETIKRHALERAPAYMHPRHVMFVDALPLSATGKIDRSLLIRRAAGLLREK